MLSLNNITFAFDPKIPFFDQLNLQLELGKMHIISGKNGVGKSTLFRILQQNIQPTERLSGSIGIGETIFDLSDKNEYARFSTQVQMVPQVCTDMLADEFSFQENLAFAQLPEFPGFARLPQVQLLFKDVFKKFGINIHQKVSELSGGQKQICAILMALSQPTQLLLLDEPSAALDEKNAQMIIQFIEHIVQSLGITVLMICHDKELVKHAQSQTELVLLSNGKRIVSQQ